MEEVVARLILATILAGIHQRAAEKADKGWITAQIQKECYLKKSKADEIVSVYIMRCPLLLI